jgi:hypothetical protein
MTMENREQEIIDAYIRGASWSVESKGDHKLLVKAACDYADKTMGDQTTDEALITQISDFLCERDEQTSQAERDEGEREASAWAIMEMARRAALAAAPKADGVRVKALEWSDQGSTLIAQTAFGGYQIDRFPNNGFGPFHILHGDSFLSHADTLEAAKAAAQADYEARILSAIEAAPKAEQEPLKPIGRMCLGCGSSWDDKRLAQEKAKNPKLLSCCPERNMVDVYDSPVSTDEVKRLREALMVATANLAAAISAYDKFRRTGATGDALYTTRIADFNRALAQSRAALKGDRA